ncbi:cell wall hydrolase [Sphingomonas jaspsi]|uniref:cell wall hydrolase n=1 Tax=Sphingomonas jaspsi TaxID=392409 RepID=UPI001FE19C7B|nr:cell wall hydrolase [Sphingomonas jaspsi]
MSLALKPSRPLSAFSREIAISAMLGVAAMTALAGVSGATPRLPGFIAGEEQVAQAEVPPAPPPMIVRDVAPDEAVKLNAAIPVANVDLSPAAPFTLGVASDETRARAIECLTSAIYYEAAQESEAGQRGVAQVILNRVRHPAFPNSVCGVVYEGSTRSTGCQFTFTCDGSMSRAPVPALWNRARRVAEQALAGSVYAPVGNATHYHANYVLPYWASSLVKTHVEGAHIFYRWAGSWGQPAAFTDRWSGREASPALLRQAALSAPHNVRPIVAPNSGAAELAQAGATVTKEGGRVRVRFTPEARAAVEKVAVAAKPYVEEVSASDNLRYALGDSNASTSSEPAFGSK